MPAPQPTEIFAITNPDWSPIVATLQGRFVEASNATLLGETEAGDRVIYKPIAGARPLWDFDAASLAIREVWAYRIDQELGFDLVPQTAMASGPFGPGAVQRYVDGEADQAVIDRINTSDPELWPVAVLDVVINNADRKASHLLHDGQSRLWAIDHGLSFHEEAKLRTVLWGLAGLTVPEGLMEDLRRLARCLGGTLGEEFSSDLSQDELVALRHRVAGLISSGRHPDPPDDRPAVPWPPY